MKAKEAKSSPFDASGDDYDRRRRNPQATEAKVEPSRRAVDDKEYSAPSGSRRRQRRPDQALSAHKELITASEGTEGGERGEGAQLMTSR